MKKQKNKKKIEKDIKKILSSLDGMEVSIKFKRSKK
jgi:hypothetical protein